MGAPGEPPSTVRAELQRPERECDEWLERLREPLDLAQAVLEDRRQAVICFLDASALIRRYDRAEPGTARMRSLCRPSAGHPLFLSRLSPVEVASAFNRKLREGRLSRRECDRLWRLFQGHCREQYRLIAVDERLLQGAEQLLFAHPLRAYDAIQLAAALRVRHSVSGDSGGLTFFTADQTQARAAEAAGLPVEYVQ